MNKAIQYREDGKFYGFDNPTLPQYINSPNIRNYEDELRSNLAAGKEIINPEVLPIHKQWRGELQKLYLKYHGLLKPGDIFDCPDNIEFEEDQFCAYNNLNCSYCGTCAGSCYKPEKIIRLKLKQEVKQVESQDATKELLLYINDLEIRTADEPLDDDEFIELIKSKFTIQRNKNGNE